MEQFFAWRNDPIVVASSFTEGKIEMADHERWYMQKLASATCEWDGVECEGGIPTGRLTPAAADRVRAAMPPKTMEQRLASHR